MANANYLQNKLKYSQWQIKQYPLHPGQGRQFDPENELQVVKTIEKPHKMTPQFRAKVFASIVKSIVHIHTGLRAWPCGKPSKCVVAVFGGVQPEHLTCLWQPPPLGDDGLVHHQKSRIDAFRLLSSSVCPWECRSWSSAALHACKVRPKVACAYMRAIVSLELCNNSTLWCKKRFPASPAFTTAPLPYFRDL